MKGEIGAGGRRGKGRWRGSGCGEWRYAWSG